MTEEITDAVFDAEVRRGEGPCVILFSSPWCGVCGKVSPRLDALAGRYDKVKFYKVDITANPKLAADLGVLGIPVLLFFKGGEEKDRIAGNVSEVDISERIRAIL